MELENIRKDIDLLDEELLNLLIKRIDLSESVIQTKLRNNLPVLNAQREEQILARVSKNTPAEYEEFILEIYKAILKESKRYQQIRLDQLLQA